MRFIYIVLSITVLLFGFGQALKMDRSHGLRYINYGLKQNQKTLSFVKQQLQNHHQKTGRYPTNDEGLSAIAKNIQAEGNSHSSWRPADENGVLSSWGDPLIYENRSSIASEKFADSGATIDTGRHYSIQVDKDVYVWSLGAQQDYKIYSTWKPRVQLIRYLSLAIAAILVWLSTRLAVRANLRQSTGRKMINVLWSLVVGLLLSIIPAMVTFPIFARSCYEGGFNRYRKPELTKDYLAIIAKYHERGIISDGAYKKIADTMKNSDPRFR